MARCNCRRGVLLAKGDEVRRMYREIDHDQVRPEKPTPQAIKAARQAVEALADIPGFERTASSMAFLADELLSMVRNAEQLAWLVKRARRLYRKWPGSRELRVLFCSRFMPRDGVELWDSEMYPEGIPSERPQAETDWKRIESGRVVSIDAALNQELTERAKVRQLPSPKQTKVAANDTSLPPEQRSQLP